MPDMLKFLIAGQQRTGSTMLVRTLDQHESICCRGELFIKNYPNRTLGGYESYIRQSLQRRAFHLLSRRRSIDHYLDEVFSAPRYLFTNDDKWRNCKAIGFKMQYGQARRTPAALRYVNDRKLPVIHLVRRNPLRILVSLLVRRTTGEANRVLDAGHSTESAAITRVKVEVADLLSSLQKLEKNNLRWEQFVASSPRLSVYYEDMVEDMAGELNRILDFLGLPRQAGLEPPTVKLNPAPISDIIVNYDEVARHLKGTAFERCLAH